MHNLVHIVVGAFLIAMTRFSTPATEGALMGVGIFYIAAFVIGVVAPDNLTIISMNGAGDGENFVHILTGVTALAAGLISVGQTEAAAKRSRSSPRSAPHAQILKHNRHASPRGSRAGLRCGVGLPWCRRSPCSPALAPTRSRPGRARLPRSR